MARKFVVQAFGVWASRSSRRGALHWNDVVNLTAL
ncbi:uncharacterized protein G2W53_042413 [Senna tora]|uniref:Uncharacterized protein n=1 Tax=Senna tora TaxID=362788 RepID=A0A834VZH1_9FABA|nr:uncharacterized protein G2W53_042405 [Senna tora]KAF7803302.1 uncharacterized protein G2W53_042413 [Senna tora]